MLISDLKPNPKNPRKVTDKKLKDLKKSMEEFGDLGGIVFNKMTGQLIGGHQRIQALKAHRACHVQMTGDGYGYIDIPNLGRFSYREVDWNEAKEKAANIAANKGAGEWDLPQLGEWFAELKGLDFDLDLTMFDEDERKQFFKDAEQVEGLTDPDEVPENVETRSKPGDLWILGNHMVLCGDSTDVLQVERLMGGEKVDVLFTDPPYNVAFNGRSGKHDVIMNDKLSDDDFDSFISNVCQTIAVINAPVHYIWCNWKFYGILQEKIPYKACIVWAKNVFGLGLGYRHQHEFCLFNGKIDEDIKNESDLWECKKDRNYVHPTQKPVELAERAFKNHSKSKNILDLFLGSGSTLIACEKTSRRCFGMELDPKYVDVILTRWEKFTGKQAELYISEQLFKTGIS